jgi:hypothetical protein
MSCRSEFYLTTRLQKAIRSHIKCQTSSGKKSTQPDSMYAIFDYDEVYLLHNLEHANYENDSEKKPTNPDEGWGADHRNEYCCQLGVSASRTQEETYTEAIKDLNGIEIDGYRIAIDTTFHIQDIYQPHTARRAIDPIAVIDAKEATCEDDKRAIYRKAYDESKHRFCKYDNTYECILCFVEERNGGPILENVIIERLIAAKIEDSPVEEAKNDDSSETTCAYCEKENQQLVQSNNTVVESPADELLTIDNPLGEL